MSEWLRRQTRNLLGSACAGSNPAVDVHPIFTISLRLYLDNELPLSCGPTNVDMSEWLRRQTRNLLGYACAGSNPAVDANSVFTSFASPPPNNALRPTLCQYPFHPQIRQHQARA
ncbi:UNVERIFIED_CONTAM: hypothetical protein Sradi_3454100 [Sesamum radiatum]|uniref:Uncharacterized protein n=1 Tax=Sesamum radiatum TaxID=300843 RepID=A0AAW2R5Y3_SESRA